MVAMWTALQGWKTYIVVAVFLVCVGMESGLGWDVPGFEVQGDWLAYVLSALGLGTLRAGISKA